MQLMSTNGSYNFCENMGETMFIVIQHNIYIYVKMKERISSDLCLLKYILSVLL